MPLQKQRVDKAVGFRGSGDRRRRRLREGFGCGRLDRLHREAATRPPQAAHRAPGADDLLAGRRFVVEQDLSPREPRFDPVGQLARCDGRLAPVMAERGEVHVLDRRVSRRRLTKLVDELGDALFEACGLHVGEIRNRIGEEDGRTPDVVGGEPCHGQRDVRRRIVRQLVDEGRREAFDRALVVANPEYGRRRPIPRPPVEERGEIRIDRPAGEDRENEPGGAAEDFRIAPGREYQIPCGHVAPLDLGEAALPQAVRHRAVCGGEADRPRPVPSRARARRRKGDRRHEIARQLDVGRVTVFTRQTPSINLSPTE
jgi:hypothetical protein